MGVFQTAGHGGIQFRADEAGQLASNRHVPFDGSLNLAEMISVRLQQERRIDVTADADGIRPIQQGQRGLPVHFVTRRLEVRR